MVRLNKINDSIFGEMFYKHSWIKQEEMRVFGRELEVDIVAAAYTGQEILEIQRESYIKYKKNVANYMAKTPSVLLNYYLDNYEYISSAIEIPEKINKKNINKELIVKLIRITAVYFDRKGRFGWLCDCAWDEEHGICILLSDDEISIKEQEYLF